MLAAFVERAKLTREPHPDRPGPGRLGQPVQRHARADRLSFWQACRQDEGQDDVSGYASTWGLTS